MKKYHTWKKAQRCHVKSKKGRTPYKAASVHTDMPTGQEFGYPPPIFTDPTHTAVMTYTDLKGEVQHGTNFFKQILWILQQKQRNTLLVFLFWLGRGTWCYQPQPFCGSPLQAGLKVDTKSLRQQIQQDCHHQKKKSVLIFILLFLCSEHITDSSILTKV